MSVRLVDADTGALLTSDCVGLDGTDLCEINTATIELAAIPLGMARIEVALWNPDDLVDGQCPNEDIFDRQPLGAPRASYQPQPALGGATYFDVGSQDSVAVQLACGDFEHLDESTCKLLVRARVDDLESGLFVLPSVAAPFDVAVGEPIVVQDNGDVAWLLGPEQLTDLAQTITAPVPRWAGEVQRPFTDHACITVFDTAAFQGITSVACVPVVEEITAVELRGLFLAKDTLQKLLQAAQLSSFPEPGLVVGRVVDHLGQGVDKVSVQPTGGGVQYLNEAGTSFLNTIETATDGFFISRDAPFGTSWTALHNVDGRVNNNVYTAGLIQGKASVVIIKLEAP